MSKAVKPLSLAMAVLFTLLAGAAFASLDEIKARGELLAGVKFMMPPFSYVDRDTGKQSGFDVELLEALAAEMGVGLKLVTVDHKTRIPKLLEGEVDIIAANLTPNPDYRGIVAFSEVYLSSGVGFIAKKGTLKSEADLKGKVIGVGKGTLAEDAVSQTVKGAKVVSLGDRESVIKAMTSGEVEVGAGDSTLLPILFDYLPSGGFEISSFQIAEIPYVLGVKESDNELLDSVNKAMDAVVNSGKLEAIFAKWFTPQSEESMQAAQAAGAIVRGTSTNGRFVAVVLSGDFLEDSEVSIFDLNGEMVLTGTISGVLDDQVYIDVPADKVTMIEPGFAVGMGVDKGKASEKIEQYKSVFESVAREAVAKEKEMNERIAQEDAEQEKIDKEKEMLYFKHKLAKERQMARDRAVREYHYVRPHYYRRPRY